MLCVRILLAAVAFSLSAGAEAQVYEHRVKAAVPRTGSHFAETIVWRSPYPFDTALVELPEQATSVLRRATGSTDTSVHPPLPTRPLSEVFSGLAKLPEELGTTGRLELFIEVDEGGTVTRVFTTKASRFLLVDQYVAAFRRMKFSPGTCGGATCKTEFVYLAWFERE